MTPVTQNEPRVITFRRNDIHRVQHLRCRVQHPFKMTKQYHTTFRNGCMDLKRCSTMVHHSPTMVNHRPATGTHFTEKFHVTKKRSVKNFHDSMEVRIGFFGYETNQWRLKAVIAVELTESFVLTGYCSRNSKRAKSYGPPKNRYPQGATSTVQGATFVQNDETVPYDF